MKIYILLLLMPIFLASSCEQTPPPPPPPVMEEPITEIKPIEVVEITSKLEEISGILLKSKDVLYAHNDGGNAAKLYEISLDEKDVINKTKISNYPNIDWEDITESEDFLFIGDFGNNSGDRTNLRILKIPKEEIGINEEVEAEAISFSYPDQEIFTTQIFHNFDCEAIVFVEDSLYVFTKNRLNSKTKLYSLPASPGSYEAVLKEDFTIGGLVTAADISNDQKVLALLGYTYGDDEFLPFIRFFWDFEGTDFFGGKNKKLPLTITGQFEALSFGDNYEVYFSHESESGDEDQYIYKWDATPLVK